MARILSDDQRRAKLDELAALIKRLSYRFRKEPFTLSAGGQSQHYFDCRQLLTDRQGLALAGALFLDTVARHAPSVIAVGGPAVGACPLVDSTMMSTHLYHYQHLTGTFFIRSEEKQHGVGGLVFGGDAIPDNAPVAIFEDVITTGASTIRAINTAKHHTKSDKTTERSFQVALVVALIDREENDGLAAVEATGPRVIALYKKRAFGVGA